MQIQKELKEVLANHDAKFLAKQLFPNVPAAQNLTPHQALIVRKIAFSESRRLNISAYTRYGKTQCVAIGIAIFILLNEHKRIKFIGPEREQAGLIRDYMSELILDCQLLLDIAEIEATGASRLKKEASRTRLTFTNGCEYRVISAHGKGFASMGHGGDVIVMDECALISRESYAKITRMLGDDPENSILIELYNPWDRDTKAYDHSINPRFERIEIDYKIGIKEGRTTEEFIEEQKEDITPLEFCVLYESKFPDESEDSLYRLSKIEQAEKAECTFETDLLEIEKIINNPEKYKEPELKHAKQELKKYKRVISCDPADKGMDWTVIYWGIQYENKYQLIGYYSEPKSESMNIVGRIYKKVQTFIGKTVSGKINIDRIGIGAGPLSRLRELIRDNQYRNVTVIGCHFGESPIQKDTLKNKKADFMNKKAENYFRNSEIFNTGLISIPQIRDLKAQLLSMKWELTSSALKRIVDPDKSPDYADALCYFTWKDNQDFVFGFA